MIPYPQTPNTMVITNVQQVIQELNQYDLNIQALVDAVVAGRGEYISLTSNDPRYSYSRVTGKVVRVLRDRTAADYYAETLSYGLDVTTHRSGKVRILVVRGNHNTGNPNADPASHRTRGPATPRFFHNSWQVHPNSWQPMLPFPQGAIKSTHPDSLVLLFFIDPQTKMIILELSDPHSIVQVGKRWQFRSWNKRIIIPIISPMPGQKMASPNSGGPKPSAGWTPSDKSGIIILDKTGTDAR